MCHPNDILVISTREKLHRAEASVGELLAMLCSSTCSSFKDFAASLDAVQLKVINPNSAQFCSVMGPKPVIPVDL